MLVLEGADSAERLVLLQCLLGTKCPTWMQAHITCQCRCLAQLLLAPMQAEVEQSQTIYGVSAEILCQDWCIALLQTQQVPQHSLLLISTCYIPSNHMNGIWLRRRESPSYILKSFRIKRIFGISIYRSDTPICVIQIYWIPCITLHGLHWGPQLFIPNVISPCLRG